MNGKRFSQKSAQKSLQKSKRPSPRKGDALRVSLALVFILFASIASRDHDTPEKTHEAREIAAATKDEHRPAHEPKQKLFEMSFLKRLTGVNGAI
jgi:hypothetical protein